MEPVTAHSPANLIAIRLFDKTAPEGLFLTATVYVPIGSLVEEFRSGLVCDSKVTELDLAEVLLAEVPFGDIAIDINDPCLFNKRRTVVL